MEKGSMGTTHVHSRKPPATAHLRVMRRHNMPRENRRLWAESFPQGPLQHLRIQHSTQECRDAQPSASTPEGTHRLGDQRYDCRLSFLMRVPLIPQWLRHWPISKNSRNLTGQLLSYPPWPGTGQSHRPGCLRAVPCCVTRYVIARLE